MAKYWSASKLAFYDDMVIPVASLPEDAVLIAEADYKSLMAQQVAGYVIVAGSDGYPVAKEQTCGKCTCLQHDTVIATEETLGHVKIGATINLSDDGTIDIGQAYGEARERDESKPTYGLI